MTDQVPIPEDEEAPALVEAVEPPTAEKLNATMSDATVQYGLKNYNAAADLFAAAAEMQDKLHGEMNPQNAELLYLYGRCLYHVAVANSDVLGGKVAGKEKKEKKSKAQGNGESSSVSAPLPSKEEKLAEEVVEAAVEAKHGAPAPEETKPGENKPYFQFTEEPDYDEDDDEEGEGEGEAGEEDEEDDFANAYEILDLARILLERQLQALDANNQLSNGKAAAAGTEMDAATRKLKERLADTYDLEAEISLENERFHNAIPDFRSSLALKHELYSQEDSLIAEAHFKLSLALEFASVTAIREAQAQESGEGAAQASSEPPQVDEALRKEAATEMEAAIESCRLRIVKERDDLAALSGDAKTKKEKQIQDVREMTEEMQQRLVDLRTPAIVTPSAFASAVDPENPLSGILGQIMGESAKERNQRVEEATKSANDLTGLVRHRKKAAPAAETPTKAEESSKRKLEHEGEDSQGKRAKTEEAI